MLQDIVDLDRHRLADPEYSADCRRRLQDDGALVIPGFFTADAVADVIAESAGRQADAFYAASTHNVYLTPPDPDRPPTHPFKRQVASSKGLIAHDQIPDDSPQRSVYDDTAFRRFVSEVLGVESVYPYADALSSINVHFATARQELGWHFDNSSFAVTALFQAPEGGGVFEYVADVRDADAGDMAFDRVAAVLDGEVPARTLHFSPGDLVVFRGRNALHRVTPTEGVTTRILAVFAFNDQPGIGLSESALMTFYGRTN
jgi:hypothetical protein